MAFLANKTVNRLNLHAGLLALASRSGGVFFGVFLLKAGVAIPVVLCAYALINAVRIAVLPFILVLGERVGLRPLVIFGALAASLQYPILAYVHGVDLALLMLCIAASVGEEFYSAAFHAYFGQLGDAEHRGHQTSARESLASVVGIVAPIAGGWALTAFGPQVAFGAVAGVQALAVLPLLGAPNVTVAPAARDGFKGSGPAFVLFVADGWTKAGITAVWQLVLFLALSSSFAAFGGAMAIAALASAVAGLFLGRHIDAGRGVGAVWLGSSVLFVCVLMCAGAKSPAIAVAANAVGALVACTYFPTMMTAFYNMAQRSPYPLRFQVVGQAGWHLGRGGGCLAAAALVALGVSLQATILLALAGCGATLILLRRHYRGAAT